MATIFGAALGLLSGYLLLKWLRRLPHAVREVCTIGGLLVMVAAFVFGLILALTDTSGSLLWLRVLWGTVFMLVAVWAAMNAVLRSMIMARDRVLADLLERESQTHPYLIDGE